MPEERGREGGSGAEIAPPPPAMSDSAPHFQVPGAGPSGPGAPEGGPSLLRGIFQIKKLDDIMASAESGPSLRRDLGAFQVRVLGIGAIVGAGSFATLGTAAAGDAHRLGAGPSLMLSFVITAVVCAFTALCYAEFAALVPISGSAYTYSYATLGELVAWIIGWDLIIEYAVGNVAVAISWANYFRTLLESIGIPVPLWLATDFRTAAHNPGRNLPIGIIASLVLCTLLYIGVAAVFSGILPYTVLKQKLATEQAEPLTMALDYVMKGKQSWVIGFVALGSVIAHTAVLLVFSSASRPTSSSLPAAAWPPRRS